MNCKDFLHRYSDYDDSLLSPPELELFSRHMARCPRCARYDRVLRKGRMLARQLPHPQPAADFGPRLQVRLHERRLSRRRWSGTSVLGGAAAGLAAVTVMLTTLWAIPLLDPAGPEMISAAVTGSTGVATEEAVAPDRLGPRIQGESAGVWAVLPAADAHAAQGWATSRVDHRVPVAYSPLVTGPPAYRVAGAFQASASTTTPHSPD